MELQKIFREIQTKCGLSFTNLSDALRVPRAEIYQGLSLKDLSANQRQRLKAIRNAISLGIPLNFYLQSRWLRHGRELDDKSFNEAIKEEKLDAKELREILTEMVQRHEDFQIYNRNRKVRSNEDFTADFFINLCREVSSE